jgi:predicted small secreted protein
MKKLIFLTIAIALSFLLASCNDDNANDIQKGTLKLSITDAPLDTDGITGVHITVSEVQYHIKDNEWKTFEDFEGPKSYNLLDLMRGESDMLGQFDLAPGTYTQLRFMLNAPEKGQGPPTSPGCYLEFEDGEDQPLFVPSASKSGYKATGQFTVPANGTVSVTADFDARKSVVHAGASGMYILKPTIRLIVDNQAGSINGEVSNASADTTVMVYAYENDAYAEAEANDPIEEEAIRFPNAISSDMVDENGYYKVAYLAPGVYDLIVVENVNNTFFEVAGIVEDIEVESLNPTVADINMDEL